MNRSTLVEIMELAFTTRWLFDLGLTEKDIMRNEKPDDIDGYVYRNVHTGEKLFSIYGDTMKNHKTGEVLALD